MLKLEGRVGVLDSAEGRRSYCYVLLKSDLAFAAYFSSAG